MTLFDLLFILVFFTTVVGLFTALVTTLRGRRGRALWQLRVLGAGVAVYMGIVVVTSLLSPRRVLAIGEPQCSDDWCITLTNISPTPIGDDDMYQAVFEISSRARRVPQRERFVVAFMLDGAGLRYEAEPSQGVPPFDTELLPGEYIATPRFFQVPRGATDLGVVVAREGDFGVPRCCIIGLGPFYKPPIWYAPRSAESG